MGNEVFFARLVLARSPCLLLTQLRLLVVTYTGGAACLARGAERPGRRLAVPGESAPATGGGRVGLLGRPTVCGRHRHRRQLFQCHS